MTDNEIVALLKENNPFLSSASPLPWENSNPDLLQLSREAAEEIEQLMRHKRREPGMPLSGLILGEPGSGKTHMLTRILRRLRNNASPAIFVSVRAFRDTKAVVQHLLKEIFVSLRRVHSKGRIQFDILMSELVDSFHEHRRQDGFSAADNMNPKMYLVRDIPQIDRNFLKCILTYINSGDSAIREAVLDWFVYGLDDEVSIELGLPLRNIDSMSDEKREQDAENILVSLGLILAYSKVSMIICFDELDLIKDRKKEEHRDLVFAWGDLISLLMNNLSGVLPLCFMKPQTWSDIFSPILSEAVVQRLNNNKMIMNTCSISQAKQLISSRIKNALKDKLENEKTADEICRWFITRMEGSLREGYSPRTVIELANHAVKVLDTNSPIDDDNDFKQSIQEIYEDEYKKVQNEPEAWPPNSEQLSFALEMWLRAHEGFEFYDSDIKNMRLIGIFNERIKFAFITVVSKNHFAATAGAKHGTDFMNENPEGFACYISETKTHKDTWKQAYYAIKEFENLGGHVIFLNDETRVQWYALVALINRIDNGDVNLYMPSGNRTANIDDIKSFLRSLKLIDFPFDNEIKTAEKNSIDDQNLIEALLKIVKTSPMRITSVAKAVEILSSEGFRTDTSEISDFVRNHNEIFRVFNSQNGDLLITPADKE